MKNMWTMMMLIKCIYISRDAYCSSMGTLTRV